MKRIRHGPGSWKREAFWDEYQLSFVNHHSVPVMIVSIRLVDAQDSNHEAGDDWYALEADSRSTWSRTALRQNLGIGARSLAVGVGRVATLVGAVAGSLAMHGFTLAAPGTAALAIPLVTETMRDANETKEREITNEFDARRIQLPATMAPGARLNGSAFFRRPKEIHVIHRRRHRASLVADHS